MFVHFLSDFVNMFVYLLDVKNVYLCVNIFLKKDCEDVFCFLLSDFVHMFVYFLKKDCKHVCSLLSDFVHIIVYCFLRKRL